MPSLLDLLGETWPARMAKSAWSAAKLPGDVYAGRTDPLSDEGIGRAADLGGMVMGGTFAGAPAGAVGAGIVKPIRAYHGSPHDFERFDLSKIGTGEGAQAYGHGLYFAENPATAQSYRDALAGSDTKWFSGNRELSGAEQNAATLLERTGNDKDKALAHVKHALRGGRFADPAYLDATEEAIKRLNPSDLRVVQNPGRMYEVNINAAPEQFLDWDKPLAQMSPEVQEKLHKAWLAHRDDHARMTGEGIYGTLEAQGWDASKYRGAGKPVATGQLAEAGIPGIKYLDQGSRGSKEGTSNYVLFRDDIIDIVKKYGLAGAAAMYGISQDEAKAAMDNPKDKKMSIGRQTYGDEE